MIYDTTRDPQTREERIVWCFACEAQHEVIIINNRECCENCHKPFRRRIPR